MYMTVTVRNDHIEVYRYQLVNNVTCGCGEYYDCHCQYYDCSPKGGHFHQDQTDVGHCASEIKVIHCRLGLQ